MKKYIILLLLVFFNYNNLVCGQELLGLLDSINNTANQKTYADAIFKSSRLINGNTTETFGKGDLTFCITHRFDEISSGVKEFWGLDESTVRLGLLYGISDRFEIGIGRSSYEKQVDGLLKYKLIKQAIGKGSPVTITLYESAVVKTSDWVEENLEYPFSARLNYVHQLLVSRKFNQELSLQLAPVIIHRNFVEYRTDNNTVFALGSGGRYKLTNRISLCFEYYLLLSEQTASDFSNPLSFGFEIETGGHIFQLVLTNAFGMTDKIFIPETTGKWADGNIRIGFNITRSFSTL